MIKINENGESYTAGKNFTLPPAVTTGTNLTSGFSGRQLDVIGQNPIYSRSTKHDWPEKTIGYSAGMQKVVHMWQEHGVRQKKCFLVDLF